MLIQVCLKNEEGIIVKIKSVDVPEHVIDKKRLILMKFEENSVLINPKYIYWNLEREQYEACLRTSESNSKTEGIDI